MKPESNISPELEAALAEQVSKFRQGTIDFMRQNGSIKGEGPTPEQEIEIEKWCAKHRLELLELNERSLVGAAAASAPFPGPLRQAFCSGPTVIMGYTLQPVNLALVSALERLELPFIAMVEIICETKDKTTAETAAIIEDKLKITIDQQLAAIYCFTTPLEQVEIEIKKGKAHVFEHARKTLGVKHHPRDLGKLNSAIIVYYVESYSTVVNYEPVKSEGDGTFLSASP